MVFIRPLIKIFSFALFWIFYLYVSIFDMKEISIQQIKNYERLNSFDKVKGTLSLSFPFAKDRNLIRDSVLLY